MRLNTRPLDQLRNIHITPHYTKYAEGSALIESGDTKVICTASVLSGVPRFLRDAHQGWVTAEYSMLPRATLARTDREASRGRQQGRTLEIQRLIGRSLRSAVNLERLGEYTVTVDCDVIQADGGTRTAAITGGCVALVAALRDMQAKGLISESPLRFLVAGISVGMLDGQPVLDLDYREDSQAETDMNVIMNEQGDYIELQGTAEKKPFQKDALEKMLSLAEAGVRILFEKQREALGACS